MGVLPWLMVLLAAGALLTGLYLLWESLRAALGATDPIEVQATAEADTRRRLIERKDALLKNLRDLKFDRDGGKISTPDFEKLDAKLRGQAKEVLRLLDEDVAPFRQRAEALITSALEQAGRSPYRGQSADRPREEVDSQPSTEAERERDEGAAAEGERERERDEGARERAEGAQSPGAEGVRERAEGAQSPGAERLECPACQTLNEPDAVFCKKCGTRVGAAADPEGSEGEPPKGADETEEERA